MPGPTTIKDLMNHYGKLAGGKGAVSGAVDYVLAKRNGMDFIEHTLAIDSGDTAWVDVAFYDSSRQELRVYDPAEKLTLHVLTDDADVLEVVTTQPTLLGVNFNATTGRPEPRVRVQVRGRGAGSAALTLSGTAASVAAGMTTLSGELTATVS